MAEAIDTAKLTGGRPRLGEGERRSHHVKVGFNGLDYDTVEYKAQQSGRNIPNYIHDAALGATVRQSHGRRRPRTVVSVCDRPPRKLTAMCIFSCTRRNRLTN